MLLRLETKASSNGAIEAWLVDHGWVRKKPRKRTFRVTLEWEGYFRLRGFGIAVFSDSLSVWDFRNRWRSCDRFVARFYFGDPDLFKKIDEITPVWRPGGSLVAKVIDFGRNFLSGVCDDGF